MFLGFLSYYNYNNLSYSYVLVHVQQMSHIMRKLFFGVSDLHKLGCTATEGGERPGILDLASINVYRAAELCLCFRRICKKQVFMARFIYKQ